MNSFWKSKSVRLLSIVLIVQAAVVYGLSRPEKIPYHKPLADFALHNPDWQLSQELPIDKETLDVLKADDLISRAYMDKANGQFATLFVAFFGTQRTGKAPHSPKNCLPGAGWAATQSGMLDINVPGQAQPITVNKYVIVRGDSESVVLYWYQSHDRVIASEYRAKVYTVADAVRYNRSDTALVRVVVNVANGDRQKALDLATSFVKTFFEPLREFLPA
jgi:EpsI family protein